ncbi:MAG: RNA polymerase sigma factor (sigma-70 family) [Kiritimatiellia bacterium]|jgi:RNA polymerase sigma factor (sigma-70 family)
MLALVTKLEQRIAHLYPELVGFLSRRVPSDPEGAAQEVWLRVAKAAPNCPDDASFRAYTYTVARRLIIDLHRRRSARIELVPIDDSVAERQAQGGDAPDDRLHAHALLDVVEAELKNMKPEIAQVFRWRTVADLSFKEIAERQSCSINTALGRMHRATKKLAAALTAAGLHGGVA